MICISPRGQVTFVSDAFGGCTTDRQILERSKLMEPDMFERGDEIMADRGILAQDVFASRCVKVNMPHTLRGKNQMDSSTGISDRRMASKRIRVERIIGLAKKYRIIENELSHTLF